MIDVLVKKYGEMAGIPEKFRHPHTFKHYAASRTMPRVGT
jgi:hypothetical protein